MPRISPATPPYSTSLQERVDQMARAGLEPLVLFTTIGRSDRAWKKFRNGSLLDDSLLSMRDRELVIDRTSARTGCEYEWGVHVWIFGEQAGLTRSDIAGTLVYPLKRDQWSEREVALLTAVDALHDRCTLSDQEFDGLKRHYTDEQVLEIIQLAAFYHQVAFIANGLALPLEKEAARFADYRGA